MPARKAISKVVKDAVNDRNGGNFCEKCGRLDSLVFHHTLAVQDGGSHDPDNLSRLCSSCHKEWHSMESAFEIPYGVWLMYPPLGQLLSYFESAKNDEAIGKQSAKDFVALMLLARDFCRLARMSLR